MYQFTMCEDLNKITQPYIHFSAWLRAVAIKFGNFINLTKLFDMWILTLRLDMSNVNIQVTWTMRNIVSLFDSKKIPPYIDWIYLIEQLLVIHFKP